MTVTLIAARVNRGDTVHFVDGPSKIVDDYRTEPGAIFWTFTDGTEVSVVPTRTFRVDIP